jgi:hypothetical protein
LGNGRPPVRAYACWLKEQAMAETPKLSVEKVLNKVRRDEAAQERQVGRKLKIAALDEEAKRMHALAARVARDQANDKK